jgi:hypothetical protein
MLVLKDSSFWEEVLLFTEVEMYKIYVVLEGDIMLSHRLGLFFCLDLRVFLVGLLWLVTIVKMQSRNSLIEVLGVFLHLDTLS